MENVRYGGLGGYGELRVSDVTYRQQVERLQQEEQYRQEMMRQRQELHRRQIDLYQRLQLPQYLSQDTQAASTWSHPKIESPKVDNSSFGPAPQVRNPSFGPAPQVRNPSGKNVLNSLTVDCSVEYELPEHLKLSSKEEKIPALIFMKKPTTKACSVSGCTACNSSSTSSMAGGISPKQRMRALAQAKSKSSNQSSFPTPQKVSSKRKLYEVEEQEIVSKRQKMATLMTPPDMMSASYFLESPSTVFQPSVPSFTHNMFQTTPSSSMFQHPQFQSVYPPMYPLHPYTPIFPRYNSTCHGCVHGICQTVQSNNMFKQNSF